MNKAELIDTVAERLGGSRREANEAVEVVLDSITRAVAQGQRVGITGFGVFEKVERPARFARNPRTGERVRVKKTAVPKFKPGAEFKGVVSGAKKLPKLGSTSTRGGAAKSTTGGRKTAAAGGRKTAAAGGRKTAAAGGRKTAAAGGRGGAAKSTAGRTARKTSGGTASRATTRKTTGRAGTARKTSAKKTTRRSTKKS